MNTRANRRNGNAEGFSLVEVMVAAVLVTIFFVSILELNAMCLRYIDASKESLAALQSIQDRSETLRNRVFSDLTRTTCGPCVPVAPATTCVTTPCVHDLMATPANPAPFSQKAAEVVTISNYPPTLNGVTQFTRSPNGSVATNSLRTNPVTDLVKVDVKVTWTMALGGRARTEQTSSIVANGTKK
ncbi:MAG: prepilin-type N-terminal cleavage/methylation domain-containing protein [Chthoniobacterales bacterium]|nr:prepilin-type N-terminal cleavage/methylation domain-containing protein [Chthoniobacterales bacterium]